MSRPIGNMTIRVDLDKTGFEKSMTGLNRQLKSVNKEMRANLSQFGRSEKSVEKYGVRIDGLSKKYAIQEKAVESAREEHKKMVEAHGENSVAAQDSAQSLNESIAKYNETGRALDSLKSEFSNFQKEQKIMDSGWYKTGDAMQNFGEKLQGVSAQARNVGGSLTKYITAPAIAVASAVGGIVAKMGWDRLVDLDSAQAKLKGLGYTTNDVGRITEQVTSAIDGGMTTMAEGVDVAAGAMAAGVKEGADLEKYIQLVGDAAVGSGRPVDEMAQIFNRVQGSGRLMTQELNQVEHGMPGFSQAMAKHLGVTVDELREMVTAGEVTSKDFLGVMDGFAGGMAEEYAKSWKGMVANTSAYVGILGESLMGGVFEQSKESIADFIELLKSDKAKQYAEELGKKISEVFGKVINTIKSVVNWYTSLSDGQKKLINSFAIFAVSIGPILVGLGTLGGIIGKVSSGIGVLFKVIAKFGGLFKTLGAVFTKLGGIFKILGTVFAKLFTVLKPIVSIFMTIGKVIGAFLITPIGAVIGVITLLTVGFVLLYKNSETFRNFIHKLGETIKEFGLLVWSFIKDIGSWLADFFSSSKDTFFTFINWIKDKFSDLLEMISRWIDSVVNFFTPFFVWLKELWQSTLEIISNIVKFGFEKISNIISFVMEFVMGIIENIWGKVELVFNATIDNIVDLIDFFKAIFTGDWEEAFSKVRDITSRITETIWALIKDSFVGKIITSIIEFAGSFKEKINEMWENVKKKFFDFIEMIYNRIKESFVGKIITSIINFAKNFKDNISKMWSYIKEKFSTFITSVYNNIKNGFVGRIISSIVNFVKNFKNNITKMWSYIKQKFTTFITSIYNNVKNSFVGRIITSIVNFAKNFRENISKLWTSVKKRFTDNINSIRNSIANSFVGKMLSSVRNLKTNFINLAKDMWSGVKKQFTNIVDGAKALPKRIGDGIRNARNKAINGMKSVGRGVMSAAGKPINATIDGVNWILGKVKAPKIKGKWKIPQYAKGTGVGGHKGGNAVVNNMATLSRN